MLDLGVLFQILNGLALLVLVALVLWMLLVQRRASLRSSHSVEEVEIFLHEFSMATEALIERYDRQRQKLEEVVRRSERLADCLEQDQQEIRSAVARLARQTEESEQEVAGPSPAGSNGTTRPERQSRLSLAPAEMELMHKMQRMKGGVEQ